MVLGFKKYLGFSVPAGLSRGAWAVVGGEVDPIGTLSEPAFAQNRLSQNGFVILFRKGDWSVLMGVGHSSTYLWGYPTLILAPRIKRL